MAEVGDKFDLGLADTGVALEPLPPLDLRMYAKVKVLLARKLSAGSRFHRSFECEVEGVQCLEVAIVHNRVQRKIVVLGSANVHYLVDAKCNRKLLFKFKIAVNFNLTCS